MFSFLNFRSRPGAEQICGIECYCLEALTSIFLRVVTVVPSCVRVVSSRILQQFRGVQGSAGLRPRRYPFPIVYVPFHSIGIRELPRLSRNKRRKQAIVVCCTVVVIDTQTRARALLRRGVKRQWQLNGS